MDFPPRLVNINFIDACTFVCAAIIHIPEPAADPAEGDPSAGVREGVVKTGGREGQHSKAHPRGTGAAGPTRTGATSGGARSAEGALPEEQGRLAKRLQTCSGSVLLFP